LELERWVSVFTRLLLSQGHKIILYDVDELRLQKLAESYNISFAKSFFQALNTDLILICTPTETIPGIINELKHHLRKGTVISEIASFKNKTIPALQQLTVKETLSIHPLFGPDISTLQGVTIAVITVNDSKKEMALAKRLFPESKLVLLDPETHDQCMASIISLLYFMNLVFSSVISEKNLPLLRELAGPTFEVQMAVTQTVIGETSDLIYSLINDNVYSWSIIQEFLDESNHLKKLLKSGKDVVDPFIEKLRFSFGGKSELDAARLQRNKILESIKMEKSNK
jgi:prephenate dehydrogenase